MPISKDLFGPDVKWDPRIHISLDPAKPLEIKVTVEGQEYTSPTRWTFSLAGASETGSQFTSAFRFETEDGAFSLHLNGDQTVDGEVGVTSVFLAEGYFQEDVRLRPSPNRHVFPPKPVTNDETDVDSGGDG